MPVATINLGGLITDQSVIRAENDRLSKVFNVASFYSSPLVALLMAGDIYSSTADTVEVDFQTTTPSGGDFIDANSNLTPISGRSYIQGAFGHSYAAVAGALNEFTSQQEAGNSFVRLDRVSELSEDMAWALSSLIASAMWTGPGGLYPLGITNAIETAAFGSQTATLSAIPKPTYLWMNNQSLEQTVPSGTLSTGYGIPELHKNLSEISHRAKRGAWMNTLNLATEECYRTFRQLTNELLPTESWAVTEESVAYGRDTILWDGQRMTWDSRCPQDRIYHLCLANSKTQKLFKKKVFGEETNWVLDYELENSSVNLSRYEEQVGMRLVRNPNFMNWRTRRAPSGLNFVMYDILVQSAGLFHGVGRHHGVIYTQTNGLLEARS